MKTTQIILLNSRYFKTESHPLKKKKSKMTLTDKNNIIQCGSYYLCFVCN